MRPRMIQFNPRRGRNPGGYLRHQPSQPPGEADAEPGGPGVSGAGGFIDVEAFAPGCEFRPS
jgi:hypothetical protein